MEKVSTFTEGVCEVMTISIIAISIGPIFFTTLREKYLKHNKYLFGGLY